MRQSGPADARLFAHYENIGQREIASVSREHDIYRACDERAPEISLFFSAGMIIGRREGDRELGERSLLELIGDGSN